MSRLASNRMLLQLIKNQIEFDEEVLKAMQQFNTFGMVERSTFMALRSSIDLMKTNFDTLDGIVEKMFAERKENK